MKSIFSRFISLFRFDSAQAAGMVGLFIVAGSTGQSADIRIKRIDGTKISGRWVGSPDGEFFEIKTGDGPEIVLLQDVAELRFHHRESPDPAIHDLEHHQQSPDHPHEMSGDPAVIFHLADGGQLSGTFVSGGEEALRCDTVLGRIKIPFDRLAGLQFASARNFPRAHELFLEALSDRLPGRDVLVTRSVDEPKSLRGRLVRLNPEQSSFTLSDRTRSVQTERLYGIVLATGVADPENYRFHLKLLDGSNISGRLLSADQNQLRMETSIGAVVEFPLNLLSGIDIRSERIVYLSDITPDAQQTRGRLHRNWPIRMDRNVVGKELSIGGKKFAKGLGCHSLCEIRYSLDGAYESFVSTIGIDDYVRPRGSVIFRVLGDDKVLFDSGMITGKNPPRDIIVDVKGVRELTLFVGYGDGLDLSDHADWADARLITPAKPDPNGRSGHRPDNPGGL